MIPDFTIYDMFADPHIGYINTKLFIPDLPDPYIFMDIPISSENIEIPVFAMYKFINLDQETMLSNNDSVVMSAYLKPGDRMSAYKSLERGMQDILRKRYEGFLYNCPVKDELYFVSQGLILDKEMRPLMMATWQVQKTHSEGRMYLVCERPILRIARSCFTDTPGTMEKLIVKKILPKVLMCNPEPCLHTPFDASRVCSVKVEIDDVPFTFRKANQPSISTTNEMLLQVALDNIEELTA